MDFTWSLIFCILNLQYLKYLICDCTRMGGGRYGSTRGIGILAERWACIYTASLIHMDSKVLFVSLQSHLKLDYCWGQMQMLLNNA